MPDDASNMNEVEPDTDTVAYQARVALEKAGGDLPKAAQILEKAVREKSALWEALVEPLVKQACYQAVSQQQRRVRYSIWNPPVVEVRQNVTPEQRAKILAKSNLMMFPLPGAGVLKDATRAEVDAAAEFYRKQSRDMGVKAYWLTLIAQSLPAGKTVGKTLTESRLKELEEEAHRAG